MSKFFAKVRIFFGKNFGISKKSSNFAPAFEKEQHLRAVNICFLSSVG